MEAMDAYPPLAERELPPPPRWTKALGVGVVVMGLAMGTGELILWPHLVAKFGLGLLWLAVLGISFQYVVNHEVARHALATGEGFFTSSARAFRWSAPFWLISAVLLYIWPGWAAALGTTLRELFGFGTYQGWAWAALGLVLLVTFLGKYAYRVLEGTLKIVVPLFFVLLVIISFVNLDAGHLKDALRGLTNVGAIPADVDWNVLLGAVVFAGAGGMLNLCVSLWYRDKQLGMASYAGHIENPVTGKPEAVAATGFRFNASNAEMLARWRRWMRYVRIDQGVIFWFLGVLSILLLSVNAYAVLTPRGLVPEGLQVAVVQAHIFGERWGTVGFDAFLIMAFLMLFSVMWTVIDALTRMVSDILYTNSRAGPFRARLAWLGRVPLSTFYYATITCVVVVGALLVPLRQPLALLVISAVLGGLAMAIYTPILLYLNNTRLPKPLRPHWITNLAMVLTSLFFIGAAIKVIGGYLGG